MTLTRQQMLERARARDRSYDGRFLTGVLSTGIYCLPSCPARNPNDANVRHFKSVADARAAGLRPCRRCHPDDFYRDHDPDRDIAEVLAREIADDPARFADTTELARRAGVGPTKLTSLFRTHFHETPAARLMRARIERACRELLGSRGPVIDAALAAGFESSSTFHDRFRRATGLTPSDYQRLGSTDTFALALPKGHRTAECLAHHARDAESPVERLDGTRLTKAVELPSGPSRLSLEQRNGEVLCRIEGGPRSPDDAARAHRIAWRMLGLAGDPSGFERRVGSDPRLARLIRGRRGARLPLCADAFEALVWSIVGQQVHLSFAHALRAALARLCGSPVGRFRTHPGPEAVARLDHTDLTRWRFSRRKAEYLIDAARAIVAGELDLERLARGSALRSEARLLDVRGLGPWSVAYIRMRGFGLADCVPVGDAGLRTALARFFGLTVRPDAAETLRRMQVFAPWRTLATFHLWKRPREEP